MGRRGKQKSKKNKLQRERIQPSKNTRANRDANEGRKVKSLNDPLKAEKKSETRTARGDWEGGHLHGARGSKKGYREKSKKDGSK